MASRDWVFDRTTGEYLTDRLTGSIPWKTAELDSTRFVIIRREVPEAVAAALRKGLKYLTGRSGHISDNIYASGTIEDAPASFQRVQGRRFLNLRTGVTALTELEAWATASPGDVLFVHKHAIVNADSRGSMVVVKSMSPRRFIVRNQVAFSEVEAWAL